MRILFKFFVLLFLVMAAQANAKVCFLPGVLNGDGCLDNSSWAGGCSNYPRTQPCEPGYEEQTCTSKGRTYYRCSCRSDNFLDSQGKYVCKGGSFDDPCGCAPENTYCSSDYKYQNCDEYPGTTASSSCLSPAEGITYYKDCVCSKDIYPFNKCSEKGLKEPSGIISGLYCEEPNGTTWYSQCDCDDSWSYEECNDRSDGCTLLVDSVYNGRDYCYLCGAETCSDSNQVNLESYWCNVSTSITTNCASLGYDYKTVCADGTTGTKCPFDSDYVYCSEPKVCPKGSYSTRSACMGLSLNLTDKVVTDGSLIKEPIGTTGSATLTATKSSSVDKVFDLSDKFVDANTGLTVDFDHILGDYEQVIDFDKIQALYLCNQNSDGCWSRRTNIVKPVNPVFPVNP